MIETPSHCLIIPCYNEESRLNQSAFSAFLEQNPAIHLLFVDDGSSDKTHAILDQLASGKSNANVLHLAANAGKAEAVRRGVMEACQKDFQTVGYWDADLATPLEEAPEFWRRMDLQPDLFCVMGSRVLRMGGAINRKLHRHIIGRVFATFASNILGLPVYDTQCGAKIFKTSIAEQVFNQPFQTYWIFDVELLYRMKKLSEYKHYNQNFFEYPLSKWNDEAGSKLKLFDFLKAPFELLKIWWHYR